MSFNFIIKGFGMNKKYSDKEVRNAIMGGFKALTDLARVRVKAEWKNMKLQEQCAAARSFVFMEQVAKNPDAYFSRSATEAAWRKRALDYAKLKKLHDLKSAYYIVQDPTGIVLNNIKYVFFDGNGAVYNRFCNAVQQWMYDEHSDTYAKEIIDMAKLAKNKLEYESAKCVVRPFILMKQGLQK